MLKLKPLKGAMFLLATCMNVSALADESKANHVTRAQSPACRIPTNAFKNLPAEVLSGTEIISFITFKQTGLLGKHYQTDTGGSQIGLYLQTSESRYEATRTYTESGEDALTARYEDLCINAAYIYGDSVRGVLTENGLLWLELESGNEFITPDLWIRLEKIE